MRRYLALGIVLLVVAAAAEAQIAPTSPGRQRAANRQALREARRSEAPYKDSHLAVTRQQLRRGGSEELLPTAGEPRFSHDGTPDAAKPKFPGLRRHKPKTEPAP